MYDRILLPTDGSTEAEHAAEHALALAERDDGTLHVLSSIDSAAFGAEVRAATITDRLEERARTAVDRLCTRATDRGVAGVRGEVVDGPPHRAILAYADEHDIDVIVMGTHGRSGIERYLLGSVTEKVVRTADVPVLTVRIPEAGTDEA